ncbi:MAG: acyl-CoA dehydrogenase family protein [Desulfobulbaceae bacterium]|nr:acyl-CoA dehydrogenase family protein [Desulfobulbaceae bacterium]
MIAFQLTDEQLAWQKKARDFAEKEIKPIALKLDQVPHGQFNWDIIRKLADYGLAWINIPKKWGGQEANIDSVTQAIIIEELAAGDAGITFTAFNTWSNQFEGLSPELQDKFMKDWCDAKNPKLSAACISEPDAGSDMASIRTTAKLDGDEWVINGTKHFISQGGVASIYQVHASIDRSQRAAGIKSFILPADLPGIKIAKPEDKMGFRSSQTGEIIFNNVRVPKQYMLIESEESYAKLAQALARARTLTAGGIGIGIARAAYETAVNYFKETPDRKKTALDHQVISFKLADMATLLDASRLMVWRAAWALDHFSPAMAEASMCKAFCSEAAMKITSDALQLLGLHGYREDMNIEKCFRDVKLMSIYEGTNEVNRLIVARSIFPR